MYSNTAVVCNSNLSHLKLLTQCHMRCFPNSFATKLGSAYVYKTLEWFLVAENRFLFHIEENKNVTGYCGGFIPSGFGDGSSSGMLQHAFKQALVGMAKQPWLAFNKEVMDFYPFIFKNVKQKIFGKAKQIPTVGTANVKRDKSVGLVVIGVMPAFRGTGIFEKLMQYFEQEARQRQVFVCKLSVKQNNERAIAAYKKQNWVIVEKHPKTFVMQKILSE